MAARRFTPLLIAGYAALLVSMVCFGMGLVLDGTWAAGSAVVGLLLVWFAHRVVDAPARAAQAAARAAAKAEAAARRPSPFNFAKLADNGDVVQEREDDHAQGDEDDEGHPAKVVASRTAAIAAAVTTQAMAEASSVPEPAAATASASEQEAPEQEAGASSPDRILSLEEVKADMALLRQAMLASRPACAPAGAQAAKGPSPQQAAEAAAQRQHVPPVDLFARTEVAGLEVSFDEQAPGTDESDEADAFPKTELAGMKERVEREDDFPQTRLERPN